MNCDKNETDISVIAILYIAILINLNQKNYKKKLPGKEMLFKLNCLFLLHLRQFAGFDFII